MNIEHPDLEFILEGLPADQRETVIKAFTRLGSGVPESPNVSMVIIHRAILKAYSRSFSQIREFQKQPSHKAEVAGEVKSLLYSVLALTIVNTVFVAIFVLKTTGKI